MVLLFVGMFCMISICGFDSVIFVVCNCLRILNSRLFFVEFVICGFDM